MSHASAVEALLFAALDAALTRLLAMDPQAAKLVELRHFAGLSSLRRRKPLASRRAAPLRRPVVAGAAQTQMRLRGRGCSRLLSRASLR
jgi:hypothetical protein